MNTYILEPLHNKTHSARHSQQNCGLAETLTAQSVSPKCGRKFAQTMPSYDIR